MEQHARPFIPFFQSYDVATVSAAPGVRCFYSLHFRPSIDTSFPCFHPIHQDQLVPRLEDGLEFTNDELDHPVVSRLDTE